MTLELIQLGFGSFIIAASVCYLLWSKVRVIFLRQDLFIIRDELWDIANRLDAFDDPHYRHTRSTINASIQAGPSISIPTLLLAAFRDRNPGVEPGESENAELRKAIRDAETKAMKRIYRYLLFERASGLFSLLIVGSTLGIRAMVKKWFDGNGPEYVSSVEHQMEVAAG